MTRDEAIAILALPQAKAVKVILALSEKAEKYDQLVGKVSPTTPSGMIAPYLKPPPGVKRKKSPGRKKGHPGSARLRPETVDHFKEHTLRCCPECHGPVGNPIKTYWRYTEDIPPIEAPEVTEHTVHGYWCSRCKKVVFPAVT